MRLFFLFTFALILFSFQSKSQLTSCSDSVKVSYYYHEDSNGILYSTTIDSFNLDSGFVTSCVSYGFDPNNMGSFDCTTSFWSKTILTYDTAGRIIENLTRIGSSSGWKDTLRTTYTFDALMGSPLTQSNEFWDGSSWTQSSLQTWTYNTSGDLIETTNQDFQSGNTFNRNRTTWNYSVDTLLSKLTEIGNGNIWTNEALYVFSYDINGARDSVSYFKWNTTNLNWRDLGTSGYYMNGLKLADFIIFDTVIVNGTPRIDSLSLSIDTLENIIFKYELAPTYYNSMGYFYLLTIIQNTYINGILKNIYEYEAEFFDDETGTGLSWYCTDNNFTSTYDAAGYLLTTIQRARCVMPREYTTTYIYDSNHLLIRETGYLDSGVSTNQFTLDLFYSNPDSVIVFNSPLYSQNWYICQGTILHPSFMAIGGCGNLQYSWSPAIGLSSDTIADPYITVNDTITYTISVTDPNGLTGISQFTIEPSVQATIALDTLPCVGCAAIIYATYSPDNTYQWYFNNSLIPNADSSSITPVQTGNYFVIVTGIHSPCTSSSDTLFYLSTLNIFNLTEETISLTPNPSSSISELKINFNKNEYCKVSITNMNGESSKQLFNGFSGAGKNVSIQLDTKQFSPGIYIISVLSEKSVRQIRWIVER